MSESGIAREFARYFNNAKNGREGRKDHKEDLRELNLKAKPFETIVLIPNSFISLLTSNF